MAALLVCTGLGAFLGVRQSNSTLADAGALVWIAVGFAAVVLAASVLALRLHGAGRVVVGGLAFVALAVLAIVLFVTVELETVSVAVGHVGMHGMFDGGASWFSSGSQC